jgi:hypothetical protein
MNSVFEITLNMRMTAQECIAYTGHWCEFCGEDNGGGKFCYECGQRESKNEGNCWKNECELCGNPTANRLIEEADSDFTYLCVYCVDTHVEELPDDDVFEE